MTLASSLDRSLHRVIWNGETEKCRQEEARTRTPAHITDRERRRETERERETAVLQQCFVC